MTEATPLAPYRMRPEPALTLSWHKLNFIFSVFVLKAVLDYSYEAVLSPVWGYAGFNFDPSFSRMIWSYVFLFTCALAVPSRLTKPMDIVSVLFFIITMVPLFTLYAVRGTDFLFMCFSVIFFVIVSTVPRLRPIKINIMHRGAFIASIICVAILASSLGWIIMRGGLSRINLDFALVYDFRDDAGATFDVGVFAYINNWSYKIVLPTLIALSLLLNYRLLSVATAAIGFLYFGMTTNKAALFLPLVVFLIYKARNYEKFDLKLFFCWGAIAAALFSCIMLFYFDDIWTPFIVLNRSLFAPPMNFIQYYEFFKDVPPVYMSNVFGGYQYDMIPAKLVSIHKFGNDNQHVNSGLLATGYMHFGFAGMVIFALIISGVLYLINSIAYNKLPIWFASGIMTPALMMSLTSVDLTVGLLTNGVLLGILLIWLFSSYGRYVKT